MGLGPVETVRFSTEKRWKPLKTSSSFRFLGARNCHLCIFFLFWDESIFQFGSNKILSNRPLPFIQRPTKVWYQMFVAALAVSLPFQLGAEGNSDGWGAGDPALGKTWERNHLRERPWMVGFF